MIIRLNNILSETYRFNYKTFQLSTFQRLVIVCLGLCEPRDPYTHPFLTNDYCVLFDIGNKAFWWETPESMLQ